MIARPPVRVAMSSSMALASIAKAGGFDRDDFEHTAQTVDDEGRQCFGFDVFGDDEQGLAGLGNLAEDREQVLGGADFLFVDQDVGIFEGRFHARRVGHEVWREVALVELHAFDEIDVGFE